MEILMSSHVQIVIWKHSAQGRHFVRSERKFVKTLFQLPTEAMRKIPNFIQLGFCSLTLKRHTRAKVKMNRVLTTVAYLMTMFLLIPIAQSRRILALKATMRRKAVKFSHFCKVSFFRGLLPSFVRFSLCF